MRRLIVLGAIVSACLAVPLAGSAAGAETVVCPQDTNVFSGAAVNLIVPQDGYCQITGARISNDLILQDDAGADISNTTVGRDLSMGFEAGAGIFDTTVGRDLTSQSHGGADVGNVRIGRDVFVGPSSGMHFERTTIGHDLVASRPQSIQTGKLAPDSPGGAVSVGHDVLIDGFPADEDFVFDGFCALSVGHDMRVTNRSVTLGFGIAAGSCSSLGLPGNTIAHDLVVSGNTAASGFFGPSSLRVGDNHVGHDLVFTGNTAEPGGALEVTNNVVGHDAICSSNTPAVTATAANVAGHSNTCG